MAYPTIYVSISDGERHLAIDGHLDLLKHLLSTFNQEGSQLEVINNANIGNSGREHLESAADSAPHLRKGAP